MSSPGSSCGRRAPAIRRTSEIAFRLENWRLLNGDVRPFDEDEFRALEERIIDHAGTHENPAAHARASHEGLDRAAELGAVRTPTLVIDAPEDPAVPPANAAFLARTIPGARLVTIPGWATRSQARS